MKVYKLEANFIRLPRWRSGKELASQCLKTRVQSLDQEDPLEKEMANHSRVLTWRIPWTEAASTGLQKAGQLEQLSTHALAHTYTIV